MYTQTVPYQPGVLLGWEQMSVGVPKIILFLPSLNLLKCPSNSRVPPL